MFWGLFNPDVDNMRIIIELAASAVILTLVFLFSNRIVNYLPGLIKKLLKISNENFEQAFKQAFSIPVKYFLRLYTIYYVLNFISFREDINIKVFNFTSKVLSLCVIILISLAAQNFIGAIPLFYKNINQKFVGAGRTIISFLTKLGKAVVIIFTIVIILSDFGYDVGGLIAGLGLSGLTFALAAQDTAQNFVSGVTILLDKPFVVGDLITVAGIEGFVEEINFRSCRIRTLDNALITVPNGKISGDSITNWTKMNMRRTVITINLLYSTTAQTLKDVCREINTRLSAMPEIKSDSILVRFDTFNSSSLDVTVTYNSYPVPFKDHVLVKEKVLYTLKDIVEHHDTDFAYNSVTVYKEEHHRVEKTGEFDRASAPRDSE